MASSSKSLLLPGQPLPASITPQPQLGSGIYSRGSHLLSSLVGYAQRTEVAGKGKAPAVATLSVTGAENRFVVPQPDSIVIARVTRVTPRQAHLSILIVDAQPCGSSSSTSSTSIATGPGNHAAGEGEGTDFQGVVRSQDVRNTDKDKVRMADCFRPGDIVRASVISLGDARSYYLSTASNYLGVIYATSSSPTGPGWSITGNPMHPISWQEMQDPHTGVIEKRKCAKPDSI